MAATKCIKLRAGAPSVAAVYDRRLTIRKDWHWQSAATTDDAAPMGLEFILVLGSTNMPRLTALGNAAKIAQPFMAGSSVNQMK
jgi:hypothetical protein